MKNKIIEFLKKLFSSKENNKYTKKYSNVVNSLSNTGLDDTYLFDFLNYGSMYRNTPNGTFINFNTINIDIETPEPMEGDVIYDSNKPRPKIAIKPIDVLEQLETIPTPFNLLGIDEKLSILKDKEKLINQHYAKREVSAMIERLNNRKKYKEFEDFFSKFLNTTDEKIDKLLEKYELVKKTSDIFIPDFPDEAIKVMTEYTNKMEELCGKKPVFYVIAEEKDFKKAYEKRDPILLVQSPFGFYWQILGAWGEEEMIVGYLF